MKKATGSIIAIVLMISVFAMNVSAAASIKSADVLKELNSVANYLTTAILGGDADMVFSNDRTIISILKAETDNEKLNKAYTASLKKSLDANNGKLIYQQNESAGSYAGAITILQLMGKDPTSFEGYNLVESFNNLGKTAVAGQSNPYMLAYTLEFVAENIDLVDDKTVATDLIESLKKLYKEDVKNGTGYDYWGISVDTCATIVTPLLAYVEKDIEVKTQVEKTLKWILEQYTPEGFNYSIEYPGINGNSTGLALSVLAETGDMENAEKAYNALSNFKSTKIDGAYGYNDKTANVGATISVINGLTTYYSALKSLEKPEETTTQVVIETTTQPIEETTTYSSQTTTSVTSTTAMQKSKDDVQTAVPKTGTSVSPVALVVALVVATGVIVVARKKSTV